MCVCVPVIHLYLSAQNLNATCPANGFTVGVNATVTCMVNKTAFNSSCTAPASVVNFVFTSSSGVKMDWCSSSYTTCTQIGTARAACGTCGCGCVKDDGTFLTHRLDFIPTLEHDAGNFSCEVVCVNSGNLPPLTSHECDQVSVGKLVSLLIEHVIRCGFQGSS